MEKENKMKEFLISSIFIIFILFAILIPSLFIKAESLKIKKDDKANSGIFVDIRIIDLTKYQIIGDGEHFLFGEYEIYTRSISHETITVYKKSNAIRDFYIEIFSKKGK